MEGRRWAAFSVVLIVGVLPMVLLAQSDEFVDVPEDHLFHENVEWLADSGITYGCNPPENDRFCPDDAVTRGQMAAFLVRALDLPAAPDQGFVDSDGVFSGDVDRLAAAGITFGCNPPENDRFCPDDAVIRGQMAAFLHRGLGGEDVPGTTTTTSSTTTSPTTSTTSTSTSTTTTSTTTTTSSSTTTTIHDPGLDVATTKLPDLVLFEAYEGTLEASGGSGSYTWEVDGLPQGLVLDAETGTIANDAESPAVLGATDPLHLTATVTDTADGDTATGEVEVDVVGASMLATQGAYSNCAATPEGTAYCWGFNGQGQLGDGTTEWSLVPTQVRNPEDTGPLTGIVDLDIRGTQPGHHACAVTDETRVYCWGAHNWGELGNPDGFDDGLPRHALPIVVLDPEGENPLENVTQVAAGDYHTCAVTTDTRAYCWGNNEQGKLGNPGVDEGPRPFTLLPVPVLDPVGESPITGLARIDTGNGHTCALTTEGGVYCWGLSNGGLGDGETTQSDLPIQVMSPDGTEPLDDVVDITVGNFHSCALTSDGTAYCWGGNMDGQLGNPAFPDGSSLPVEVRNGSDDGPLVGIDQLSAGTWHTCALTGDTAQCWGSNGWGKLGNGDTEHTSLPVTVLSPEGNSDFTGLAAIEAGQNHTCAFHGDGAAYCWGLNLHGQLGNGKQDSLPPVPNPLPIPVHPVAAVVPPPEISTTELPDVHVFEQYTAELEVTGGEPPYQWAVEGLPAGLVVDPATGTITRDQESPILSAAGTHQLTITVTDTDDVIGETTLDLEVIGVGEISSGHDHTCAVTSDTALYCWGKNWAGQLGDGTFDERHLPTPVAHPDEEGEVLTGVETVSTSGEHTCAITTDSALYCWGWNGAGRLGQGHDESTSIPTPGRVVAANGDEGYLSDVTAVATGGLHSCAITVGGIPHCWGDNFRGQLGSSGHTGGTPTTVLAPDESGPFQGVTSIGTGSFHTCITTKNGPAHCWGWNQAGQLGVGETFPIQSTTPLVVGGSDDPFLGLVEVDSGTFHNCAMHQDGGGWCWGLNNHGQLGDGNSPDNAMVPAPVADPTDPGAPLVGLGQISTGVLHSCALSADGNALCWGNNENGAVGDGTTEGSDLAVGVVDPDDGTSPFPADMIDAGKWQTCAVRQGIPWCWGHNEFGQLGDGTTTDRHTPVAVMPQP